MNQKRPANFVPYFNKIEETLIVQIFQLIRNWFRSCTTPLERHSGAPGGRWSQFPVQRFSRGDIWRHCRARGCGGTGCFRNRPEGWGLNFGSAAGSETVDDWRRSVCNWCNEVPVTRNDLCCTFHESGQLKIQKRKSEHVCNQCSSEYFLMNFIFMR